MSAAVRAKFPEKPFQISETGAGAISEFTSNSTPSKWTTSYQTDILRREAEFALANENVSVLTFWHFFDFKGADRCSSYCKPCEYAAGVFPPRATYVDADRCFRPCGANHKGVVDFWRRPKPSYAVVVALFRNATAKARAHAQAQGQMEAAIVV
jgi:beta-glucuronidase